MIIFRMLMGVRTNFVTILRDPWKNFESSYSYFDKEREFNLSASEYLQRSRPIQEMHLPNINQVSLSFLQTRF